MSGALGLVRVMAEAEQLRWRLLLRRSARRGGLLLGGLVFRGAALAMGHVLAVAALTPRVGWVAALGMVTGFDLVVGLVLVLVLCAVRQGPGNTERTAVMLRESARAQLASGVGMLRLLTTLVGALRK